MPRPVDTAEYLAFLPPHWRERALAVGEPQSTWWRWRDMRVHILSLPRPQARAAGAPRADSLPGTRP